MIKKIVGILTLLSAVSFVTLLTLVYSQGVLFQASMVKMTLFMLCMVVATCGLHLIETHCEPKKIQRMGIWALAIVIVIVGGLVSYDILDYQSHWNHLLAVGIIYITLVELQLLKWEKSRSILKILGLLTLVSNLFLTVYFMALLREPSLGIVLDIAVITSVFAFLFGLILSRKKKSKVQTAES